MVPYLYNDLFKIIKEIMNLIVKPDIMVNCINGADPKNVDLSNEDNFMKPKCHAAYSKYKGNAKAKQEVSKEKSIVISEISKISFKRSELLEVRKSLDEELVVTIREAEKDERNCFTILTNR